MHPVRPDYEADCVVNVVPALLGLRPAEDLLPSCVAGATAVVLLVLDGVGWGNFEVNRLRAPVMSGMEGRSITTVVPSTTAAALTSIASGTPPARHGLVGYRMRIGAQVLDVLRWRVPSGPPPAVTEVNARPAFCGLAVPTVTRSEFVRTGFTEAHMRGARFVGWRTTGTLVEHVRQLVAGGEPFVYAYYDGVDKVAHEYGLRQPFYAAELGATDRMVGDLLNVLPESAALVITSDHGQVHFGEWLGLESLDPMVSAYAGDARFRYLYARPGAEDDLVKAAEDLFGDRAWVFSRDRLVDEGWLGPEPPAPEVLSRIGDVALAARGSDVFIDPTHPMETRLIAGHGSLTVDEMLVPLLGARGRA
ncbi:MAG TPA: alkaline phosphatase family protein [Acidimicrobiia bacterium]|nr:alkaline phosphatase family protein [Acidimicrobiia bacterium]